MKESEKMENAHAAEAHEIEKQLKTMREKADSLAANVKTMGLAELRALKHRTARFMEEAREHGGDYMREAGHKVHEKADEYCENLSETIRHKPLTSVGIAAAVGFVLALLAKR